MLIFDIDLDDVPFSVAFRLGFAHDRPELFAWAAPACIKVDDIGSACFRNHLFKLFHILDLMVLGSQSGKISDHDTFYDNFFTCINIKMLSQSRLTKLCCLRNASGQLIKPFICCSKVLFLIINSTYSL